jgi:hypothetical protein
LCLEIYKKNPVSEQLLGQREAINSLDLAMVMIDRGLK